jgi:ferritin-like metal-binding protein YciE
MADSETDVTRSIFTTGVKNAHAMENQALSIMKPQLKRIEKYPEVAERLDQHIRETEGQIGRLNELLDGLDESHSALKDTALSTMGTLAALSHTVAGDEIIKNSLANFAFENYEIAAYNSLIAMAEAGAFEPALAHLQANLQEEKSMARWLEENLKTVTLRFVSLREAGESADI